jgi:hypothetical protein
MARPLWLECKDAIYHLCARSNGRKEFFMMRIRNPDCSAVKMQR